MGCPSGIDPRYERESARWVSHHNLMAAFMGDATTSISTSGWDFLGHGGIDVTLKPCRQYQDVNKIDMVSSMLKWTCFPIIYIKPFANDAIPFVAVEKHRFQTD